LSALCTSATTLATSTLTALSTSINAQPSVTNGKVTSSETTVYTAAIPPNGLQVYLMHYNADGSTDILQMLLDLLHAFAVEYVSNIKNSMKMDTAKMKPHEHEKL